MQKALHEKKTEIKRYKHSFSEQFVADCFEHITPRKAEILTMHLNGRTDRNIGKELFISPHTVRSHRTQIMELYGINNKNELFVYMLFKRDQVISKRYNKKLDEACKELEKEFIKILDELTKK